MEWSRYELQKLVCLVSCYGAEINYEEVARALFNRSADDVRKRWVTIRTHLRRQMREHVLSLVAENAPEEVRKHVLSLVETPYRGELHPHVRWIETQWDDLNDMDL